jgi:hypothetical protein
MTTPPPDRPPAPTWLESMPRRVVSDKERGNSPKRHQSLDRYLGRTTGQQRGETRPWLASAVTIVGVLTTLSCTNNPIRAWLTGRPSHNNSHGIRRWRSCWCGHDGVACLPNLVTTPDPATAPVGPASQPAPASPAPQVATIPITPALGAPAPDSITSLTSSPQTPLKRKTLPHLRVNSVPAPPPAAVVPPVTPAPQTEPVTPTKSAKPGSPDGW